MFVGHLALAFAAKRRAPALSLGWTIAAVTAIDLVWPILLLLGLERVRIEPGATAFTPLVFESYPWTHSLAMAMVWGVLLAALARSRGVAGRDTVLLAILVASHWILDLVTHAPDLPLWPGGGPLLGLGLWDSIPGTFLVEGLLWVGAIGYYLGRWRPRNRSGAVALWSFILVSTAIWAGGPWSPAPASTSELAWFALIGWITIPWAIWIDRNAAMR